MDGHFVPNITIGPPVVAALKRVTTLPLDVHLMITDPDRYLEAFASAGAVDHYRAQRGRHASAPDAHAASANWAPKRASRSILRRRSTTSQEVAGEFDVLLIMSVNPGFGGQTFIPRSVAKVAAARSAADRGRQRRRHRSGRRRRSHERRQRSCRRRRDDARRGRVDLRHADPGEATQRLAPRRPGRSLTRRCRPPSPQLRVRYAETDRMGVVYYANYLVWFEVARADLLRSLGWTYREMEETGVSPAGDRGALRIQAAGAVR